MTEPNKREIELGAEIRDECLADGAPWKEGGGYAAYALAAYREEIEAKQQAEIEKLRRALDELAADGWMR